MYQRVYKYKPSTFINFVNIQSTFISFANIPSTFNRFANIPSTFISFAKIPPTFINFSNIRTLFYGTVPFTLPIIINIMNARVYTRNLNAIQNIKVGNSIKVVHKVEI